MAAPNLFQELHNALQEFKDFLDQHAGEVKPAIQPLDQLTGGRVVELLNKLIDLMNQIKTQVDSINASAIPGLAQATAFTQSVTRLLQSAKTLLPDEASTIDDILGVADIVTGLPSVDQVKGEIDSAIEAIITHLNDLKTP